MPLPKTIENADVRETSQIIYHSKCLYENYPNMYVLSNLSNFIKSYGHLSEILAISPQALTKYGNGHVTFGANFETLWPSSYLALNFRKIH